MNRYTYISKYEKPKSFLEAQLELAFKFVFFFWRRVKNPLRTFIFDTDRALFAVQDGDFSTDFLGFLGVKVYENFSKDTTYHQFNPPLFSLMGQQVKVQI